MYRTFKSIALAALLFATATPAFAANYSVSLQLNDLIRTSKGDWRFVGCDPDKGITMSYEYYVGNREGYAEPVHIGMNGSIALIGTYQFHDENAPANGMVATDGKVAKLVELNGCSAKFWIH